MLGSSIRTSIPTHTGLKEDANSVAIGSEEETDSFPPMYNPRNSWGGDERKDLGNIPAAGSPPYGPRSTQDLMDLEEENRVLRREVARLQQLNEARRKQLQEMQAKIDGSSEWQSAAQREDSQLPSNMSQHQARRPMPGGGGAPGRLKTPSPSRHSPDNEGASRLHRLETLVERWKQKCFTWEERYALLVTEASKAEGKGSTAMGEALKLTASVGKTGLQDQMVLEDGIEALRSELIKAKDTIGSMSARLRQQSHGQVDGSLPASPEEVRSPTPPSVRMQTTYTDSSVCHQCAEYRYKLADLNRMVAEEEAVRRAKEATASQFPYSSVLPGMESLQASMLHALHGRNATGELLKLTHEYVDSYLEVLGTIPLPSVPIGGNGSGGTFSGGKDANGLYVCFSDDDMTSGEGL
eukprot:TRINITY_DN7116_c5_g1_i1.p1 TRINITY_DN7116_c5_g1~~TRINITY_DN7116_c5_g1_i1.p1  ORF type:complete len:422 (+),score=78.15 TRINITY_DN7116_c5_g1_i1:39-1268(+)